LFLTSLLIIANPARVFAVAADNYQWVQHQPSSSTGHISGVAIDSSTPSTVYILTATAGVYKSTDNGDTWTQKNTGLPAALGVSYSGLGNLLTMDPNNSSVLYANIGGVPYKTTNGANSWTSIGAGISVCSPSQVAGVAVDPTNSNHIFAAHVASGCSGGIFESTDAGSNWTQIAGIGVGSGLGNDAWTLAIDPTDNQKMYVGTIHFAVAYSSDGGHNWTQNFPTGAAETSITIAVNPATPSRVLLGNASGLYLSTDNAHTWTSELAQVSSSVDDIKFAPSNSAIGYLASSNGIYKTTDGGLNWTQMGQASLSPVGLAIDPNDPTVIYIATSALGIYRSIDSGATATAKNTGLPTSSNMQWITQSSSNHDIVLVGAHQSAATVGYKSTDRGFTWSMLGVPTGTTFTTYGFNIHPTNPDIIYARTYTGSAFKFFKSIDGGSVWADTGITITGGFGWSAIDPTTPSTLLVVDLNGYMQRSDNSGTSWTTEATFNPTHGQPSSISNDVEFAPSNSQIVYAASYQSVWTSSDNGVNWTQQTNGIPQDSASNWVNYVSIDPTNANIAYASTRAMIIYKTTDGGATWAESGTFAQSLGKVVVDAVDHTILYLDTGNTWYKSTDSGANWVAQPQTGTFETGILSLIQDKADSNRFLMSGSSKGVTAYENSIPNFSTSTISAVDDNGGTLQPSETQTYTVNLINTGYGTATNTNAVITLNSNLSYRSGTAKIDGTVLSSNPLSSNVLTIPVGTLIRNQQNSVTFQTAVANSCSLQFNQGASETSSEDTSGTTISTISINTNGCNNLSVASAPTCSDNPPFGSPDLFQIRAYKNRSILYFAPPGGQYSNFFIAYGFSDGDNRFGTSFGQIHSIGAISHEIRDLSPNTTYYFRVRGGNGCATGNWSNTLKIKTTSGNIVKYYHRYVPPLKKVLP